MAAKCVHKGCGKTFSDPEEECVYHPGPPVFHEGQKGKYLGCWSYSLSVSFLPCLHSTVHRCDSCSSRYTYPEANCPRLEMLQAPRLDL